MKEQLGIHLSRLVNIWKETKDAVDLFGRLKEIGNVYPYNILFSIFISSTSDATSFFKNIPDYIDLKVEDTKENSSLLNIKGTFGNEKQEIIEGKVILYKIKPNVYCFISVSKNNFLEKCLKRILSYSYPYIFQPIIKQIELKQLLVDFEKRLLDKNIRIKKCSSKRWVISGEKESKRKSLGSRIDWEDVSIQEAFIESAEESKWFTKLTFEITGKENDYFVSNKGSITKRGVIFSESWLPEYSLSIINNLIEISEKKLKVYRNRSRSELSNNEIRPLVFKFSDNVFNDSKNTKLLISILKKIKGFGYSVIHSNPYVHMSLLDYKNGSSFEILIHKPNQILIMPQIKVSSTSFEKLIGKISEEFREGEIFDLQEVR